MSNFTDYIRSLNPLSWWRLGESANPSVNEDDFDDVCSATNPDYFWKMDDSTGSTIVEEIASNDGTSINSPLLQQTPLVSTSTGKSITLNGTTQAIDTNLTVGNYSARTVTMLFKLNGNTSPQLLFSDGSEVGTTKRLHLGINGDYWAYIVSDGFNEWSESTTNQHNLVVGDVYFLAYVINGHSVKIYLNGELKVSLVTPQNIDAAAGFSDLMIGKDGSQDAYYGNISIDNFCLYNRALTSSAISDYNPIGEYDIAKEDYSGLLNFYEPIAYWNMTDTYKPRQDYFANSDFTVVSENNCDITLSSSALSVDFLANPFDGLVTSTNNLLLDFKAVSLFSLSASGSGLEDYGIDVRYTSVSDSSTYVSARTWKSNGLIYAKFDVFVSGVNTYTDSKSASVAYILTVARKGSDLHLDHLSNEHFRYGTPISFVSDELTVSLIIGSSTTSFDNKMYLNYFIVDPELEMYDEISGGRTRFFTNDYNYLNVYHKLPGLTSYTDGKSVQISQYAYSLTDDTLYFDTSNFAIIVNIANVIDAQGDYLYICDRIRLNYYWNYSRVQLMFYNGTGWVIAQYKSAQYSGYTGHCIITRDGNTLKMYNNGVLYLSGDCSTIASSTNALARIGDTAANKFKTDEFAIYDRNFTSTEANEVYQASIGNILDDTLVAFDQMAFKNGNYVDFITSQNSTLHTGEQSLLPFESDTSIKLSNANSFVNFGDAFPISPTTEFSIFAVIKLDSNLAYRTIFARMGAGASYLGYVFEVDVSNKLRILIRHTATTNELDVSTNSTLSIDTIYHVAVTYDGTNANGIAIYVNGVSQNLTIADNTFTTAPVYTNIDAHIGSRTNEYSLSGTIDEVMWFDKELTSSEIYNIYTLVTNDILTQYSDCFYNTVMSKDLVAYWRLGESTGTTAVDETGNYDCTYINSPELGAVGLVIDDLDTSVNFNGTTQYLSENDIDFTDGSGNDNAFSIHFIANADSFGANKGAVIAKWTSGISNSGQIVINFDSTGKLSAQLLSGDTANRLFITTKEIFSAGTSYCGVFTYDGSETVGGMALYVNGQRKAITNNSSGSYSGMSTATGDAPFTIASYLYDDATYKGFFDGVLDEVIIFNYELEYYEVNILYNYALVRSNYIPLTAYGDYIDSLSPVANWRLGEVASSTTAIDETGSYNGTYLNTPTLGTTGLLAYDDDTACSFSSSSSEWMVATTPTGCLIDNAKTISCIVTLSSTTANMGIISNRINYGGVNNESNGWILLFDTSIDTFKFSHTGGLNIVGTTEAVAGQTYHLVVTTDTLGKNLKLYINGNLEDSLASSTYNTETASGYIGIGNQSGSYMNGVIDEVVLLDYALDSNSVKKMFDVSIGLYYKRCSFEIYDDVPLSYGDIIITDSDTTADTVTFTALAGTFDSSKDWVPVLFNISPYLNNEDGTVEPIFTALQEEWQDLHIKDGTTNLDLYFESWDYLNNRSRVWAILPNVTTAAKDLVLEYSTPVTDNPKSKMMEVIGMEKLTELFDYYYDPDEIFYNMIQDSSGKYIISSEYYGDYTLYDMDDGSTFVGKCAGADTGHYHFMKTSTDYVEADGVQNETRLANVTSCTFVVDTTNVIVDCAALFTHANTDQYDMYFPTDLVNDYGYNSILTSMFDPVWSDELRILKSTDGKTWTSVYSQGTQQTSAETNPITLMPNAKLSVGGFLHAVQPFSDPTDDYYYVRTSNAAGTTWTQRSKPLRTISSAQINYLGTPGPSNQSNIYSFVYGDKVIAPIERDSDNKEFLTVFSGYGSTFDNHITPPLHDDWPSDSDWDGVAGKKIHNYNRFAVHDTGVDEILFGIFGCDADDNSYQTEPSKLFKSDDWGVTWTLVSDLKPLMYYSYSMYDEANNYIDQSTIVMSMLCNDDYLTILAQTSESYLTDAGADLGHCGVFQFLLTDII